MKSLFINLKDAFYLVATFGLIYLLISDPFRDVGGGSVIYFFVGFYVQFRMMQPKIVSLKISNEYLRQKINELEHPKSSSNLDNSKIN